MPFLTEFPRSLNWHQAQSIHNAICALREASGLISVQGMSNRHGTPLCVYEGPTGEIVVADESCLTVLEHYADLDGFVAHYGMN